MASITAHSSDANPEEEAQNMAALLAKTVQTSIEMGNTTELAAAGIADDSLRVALAALASPLVAQQYKQGGQIPSDQDLKKITSALQAVLTFSENFAPSPENIERLKALEANGTLVDTHQTHVQYIHAFVPVINVIGGFSFGQSEQKLVTEITRTLVDRAESLRQSLLGDQSEDDQKLAELGLLRALSEIYAQCHEAETAKLMAMNEEERTAQPQAPGGGLSLESVWKGFDLRVGLLEEMAKNILPKDTGTTNKAPAPPPAPVQTAPQVKEQPAPESEAPPPEQPPQQASEEETQSAPQESAQGSSPGGPMSFFKTPPDDDE